MLYEFHDYLEIKWIITWQCGLHSVRFGHHLFMSSRYVLFRLTCEPDRVSSQWLCLVCKVKSSGLISNRRNELFTSGFWFTNISSKWDWCINKMSSSRLYSVGLADPAQVLPWQMISNEKLISTRRQLWTPTGRQLDFILWFILNTWIFLGKLPKTRSENLLQCIASWNNQECFSFYLSIHYMSV